MLDKYWNLCLMVLQVCAVVVVIAACLRFPDVDWVVVDLNIIIVLVCCVLQAVQEGRPAR